ncbi:Peptide chain release factor 3 [bioreactor metagenome]|uniref:Peptide chain release factor 3 n=1 Tax=bioreactor metagenome TaxID=1076179 RepID=A0A645BX28_9ZZZZ
MFPPERFARVQAKDTMKRKQFVKGITQLTQEGAVQLFRQADAGTESYIIGTVGSLQFDVLEYRLKNEYGVDLLMNHLPFELARWLDGQDVKPSSLRGADRGMFVYDVKERPVLLVSNEWALRWVADNNPDIRFLATPADRPPIE